MTSSFLQQCSNSQRTELSTAEPLYSVKSGNVSLHIKPENQITSEKVIFSSQDLLQGKHCHSSLFVFWTLKA